ncbi:hypothetical protein HDU82_002581 [Entophlyctis luteolus]|nr:hypothetical protein HDU82_002581 [Entophlyctis luteolus]
MLVTLRNECLDSILLRRLIHLTVLNSDEVSTLQTLMRFPPLSTTQIQTIPNILKRSKSLCEEYHKRILATTQTSDSASCMSLGSPQNKSVATSTNSLDSKSAAEVQSDAFRNNRIVKTIDACIQKLSHWLLSPNDDFGPIYAVVNDLKHVKNDLLGPHERPVSHSHVSAQDLAISSAARNSAERLHTRADGVSTPLRNNGLGLDSWLLGLSSAAQDVDLAKTVKAASTMLSGLFEDKQATPTQIVQGEGRSNDTSVTAVRASRYPPGHWSNSLPTRTTGSVSVVKKE